MLHHQRTLSFILLLSLSQSIAFGSLAEKKRWRELQTAIQEFVQSANAACGASFSFAFDEPSFKSWDFETKELQYYCNGILKELEVTCGASAEGKKAASAQIKKVTCYLRRDTDPEEHSLKSGALRYSISGRGYNSHDGVWLKRHLQPSGEGSLKDAEQWTDIDKRLADGLRNMNSLCGTRIALDVKRSSFKGRSEENAGGDYCAGAIDVIERKCGEESLRKKIASKLKHIECFAVPFEDSQFQSFKGGTVVYNVGRSRSTDFTKNSTWFESHLK